MQEFTTSGENTCLAIDWFLILRTNKIYFQTRSHLVLENITNAPSSFLTLFLFNLPVTLFWLFPNF